MRYSFDHQLEQLHSELAQMGALCENAIALAAKSLFTGDLSLAEKAVKTDAQIDIMEHEIEDMCLNLILRQQPVAHDLRTLSAALKMITDMERIGDQAADIADMVKQSKITANQNDTHVYQMALDAIKMVSDSVHAYISADLSLAQEVISYDDVVDNLFVKVKEEITHCDDIEYAIDLLMIAKYLERIADHAENIAEWVVFSVTGFHKIMMEK